MYVILNKIFIFSGGKLMMKMELINIGYNIFLCKVWIIEIGN